MTPLRVLVVGDGSTRNVCSVYRTGMFVPYLADRGVEVRFGAPELDVTAGAALEETWQAEFHGESEFARTHLEWADVIVFRRIYQTHLLCLACDFATTNVAEAHEHGGIRGHHVEVGQNWLVRAIFERFESDPRSLGGRGVVYETDDDLLHIPEANALKRLYRADLDLVERMARFADVVTTSTPVLAARFARFNPETRVVRNAVDPRWYGDRPSTRPPGDPRILYYGSSGRLIDYEVCRDAVDAAVRRHPGARRVWLGAPDAEALRDRLRAVADELLPFVIGVPAFCRAISEACPDVGVAPVIGSDFDLAKSELHWLDYSMAGAATVASRAMGDGPYSVIRPGVDGLLARSKADWRDAVERLAGSRALREELAGRARERVLAEYTAAIRAAEWEDVYRSASERGREPRRAAVAMSPPTAERRAHGIAPSAPDLLAAYVTAQRYATLSPLLLFVGPAPAHFDGWVHLDLEPSADIVHDVAFGVPFGDGCVDAIYATVPLEDLGPAPTAVFLRDAWRALRPGGVLRLITRDRTAWLAVRERLAAQGVILQGTRAVMPLFDTASLPAQLRATGFAEVRVAAIDDSRSPAVHGLEALIAHPPDELLVVEAVR